MSVPSDRRSRKRLATRQAISHAAKRLFIERGFDHVTVDEIAEAADVGRKTVFNYFPRKEDMFFNRHDEAREVLRTALRQRAEEVAPVEAYRLLAHRLVKEKYLALQFSQRSEDFVAAIEGSEILMARVRRLADELAEVVRRALSESVGRDPDDLDAHLAAKLLLATWSVAFLQAHRTFRQSLNSEAASHVFLSCVEKGTLGIKAAMSGTPYA